MNFIILMGNRLCSAVAIAVATGRGSKRRTKTPCAEDIKRLYCHSHIVDKSSDADAWQYRTRGAARG